MGRRSDGVRSGQGGDVTSTRQRFSTQVSKDVQTRVRATVRGMTSSDPDYSLAKFTEDALEAHCRKLEVRHNEKQPWPRSKRRLRTGPRTS